MDRARRSRRRLIIVGMVVLAFAAPVVRITSVYRQQQRSIFLVAAIHRKDSGDALALIRAGVNPNMVDSGIRSVTLGSLWRQMLDRFHGRVDRPLGSSALDLAVDENLSAVACALLDQGAAGANDRIQITEYFGGAPISLLSVAVNRPDPNLVLHLLLHGAEVNSYDKSGLSPLCLAATNQDLPMVTMLVAHHADPSAYNDDCGPALYSAIVYGHDNPHVVKYLLDHGANPNGDSLQYIPLLQTDSAAIVADLIAHGADVRLRDQNGISPIVQAADCGNWEGVKLLLDHGAGPDDHDGTGKTPMRIAVDRGSADHVALLLRHGANVNSRHAGGRTPLMWAAEAGTVTVVRLLLEHGADRTARDDDGRTALFIAASSGNVGVTKVLIQASSMVNARDIVGQTALDGAEETENGDTVSILRRAGALSGTAVGGIPLVGRILGLRLGYAGEDEADRRLDKWTAGSGAGMAEHRWAINDAIIYSVGFNRSSTDYTISGLDVSDWHGRLRSNVAFQRYGCGPWGDLRIGMTIAEARAVLRSKLPPATVKPGALSWIAHAHGHRAGRSVLFTYTATLDFNNGLRDLRLEIGATRD